MVLDRHRLEVAASSGSLGLLADDVLLALLRHAAHEPLSDRDRRALTQARDLLKAVVQLQGQEVASSSLLRSMAPLAALDETVDVVSTARTGGLEDAITQHVMAIDQILEGTASESMIADLHALFERLAELTWARSDAIVHPPREQHHEWIKTVSS
jgi:hypothetical protein